MTRRFFLSALATETNTFSNIPTTRESFQIERGQAILEGSDAPAYLKALVADLARDDIELVAGFVAFAQPGAPTQQSAYEGFRAEILDGLKAAAPVDAVLLTLHGAMVAQDCDDCEGDLLAHVRALVGPDTPIGVVLDPHAHLSPLMVEKASVMAFMKEYPHTDGPERTADIVAILRGMLDAGVRPTPAVFDCRLIGFFPTQLEPMRSFVDRMMALEGRDGVLTASFVHGFPWGDTPFTGAKTLVYTDGDPAKAATVAQALHQEIWAIKDQTLPPMLTVEQAVAEMAAPRARPLVVADFADNPGGGAPSDSTYLLRGVLEAGLSGVAFGLFFDPQAVRVCHEVGVGGKLDLRLGGKIGRASGQPLDLQVEVMGVVTDAKMSMFGLGEEPIGDTAWVRCAGVDIVLNTLRNQLFDTTGLSHIGIDPTACSAVVVKSSNHFTASFGPIAEKVVYVGGPGALDLDFAHLGYRAFTAPYYPKSADPFGLPG
jgi:microcystin degradation protein MlrC